MQYYYIYNIKIALYNDANKISILLTSLIIRGGKCRVAYLTIQNESRYLAHDNNNITMQR